jgi:hypothetical protein
MCETKLKSYLGRDARTTVTTQDPSQLDTKDDDDDDDDENDDDISEGLVKLVDFVSELPLRED